MIFGIISHAVLKIKDKKIYAYEPYVREMNLWGRHVDEIIIIAPVSKGKPKDIETPYHHNKIRVIEIPNFDITSFKNILRSILVIPRVSWLIYKTMKQVDHMHLRCPGNIGLLGCFIQILFPLKPKTVKYAGNWDPHSKQPFSYRMQKWLLSNTFLTRNCKVLVYGEWDNQTKNIIPFFTASYHQKEIIPITNKKLSSKIRCLFVGTFSEGKQPMLSVKVIEKLLQENYTIQLDMYGEGPEFKKIQTYLRKKNLEGIIFLHGNQPKEVVKKAYQQSHFLIFISKSEGWPKVVAEAMFWGCLPISSKVSCVESMLGNGSRGTIIAPHASSDEIVQIINGYVKNEDEYQQQVLNAKKWSQQYTLEKFEHEIKKLLLNE
jgi:glycosyltransferase involved in cell wall biosynthesis